MDKQEECFTEQKYVGHSRWDPDIPTMLVPLPGLERDPSVVETGHTTSRSSCRFGIRASADAWSFSISGLSMKTRAASALPLRLTPQLGGCARLIAATVGTGSFVRKSSTSWFTRVRFLLREAV